MMRRLLCAVIAVVMILCLLPWNAMEVKAASAMQASNKLAWYIKDMEGFDPIPKWDYVQWTVGFGTRCPDEDLERYLEEGIPIDEAEALFKKELDYYVEQVNQFLDDNDLTMTQSQFDALVSLTYNCGPAWLTRDSDLRDGVLNGATGNTFIGLLSQRVTAGGEYLPGLMRRRLTEADMYLHGRYDTHIPENYCYVFYDAGEGKGTALAQGYDCDLYAAPLVTATREGYTFLGWYTAETGGVKVTSLDENLHQMTLYAHWAEGDGEYKGDSDIVEDGGILVTVTGSVLNVRKGPGTSYRVVGTVDRGEKLVITQVTTVDGRPWGKFEKGWVSLTYTDYEEKITPPGPGGVVDEDDDSAAYEAPVYVTVVGKSKLTVYNGPDVEYPVVGSLNEGDEVLLVETYKMFTSWWGRLESGGWICLDRYTLLHNDQKLAHSVKVTVTNSYLNVRSGPGTEYGWLSSLSKNDVVEILAVEVMDSDIWGRFSGGWISLQYTNFDADRLEEYWHHSYQSWYTVSESNCVTHGQERRNCRYCDDFETRELPLTGHSYGQWYVSREATCADAGQERRDCVHCSAYETRETECIGHNMGQWYVVTEPTCVEAGQERRDCENCDHFETKDIQPGGHSMGDWYVSVEPSYTQEGEERRDCQHCDYFETRVLGTTEHDFGQWYVVTEPTCTDSGLEQRDCAVCGLSETREVEALGHSFTQWEAEKPATCTEPGVNVRHCQVCGLTEKEEIAPLGHDFSQWGVVTAPTCTEDGERQRHCMLCGQSESETIAALGHQMGEWTTVREATCTKNGQMQRCCTACDYSESKTIASTGHSMGQWVTVKEATCTEKGQKKRECANCDYSQTTSVAMKDHNYCDWYISIEPTYNTPGEERRDCENCDAYETRVKEFNGQVVTKVYATITVASLTVRNGPGSSYKSVGYVVRGSRYEVYEQATASNGKVWGRIDSGWICLTGYTTLEEETQIIGHTHTFGEWYALTEATCTEGGKMRRDCSGCAHYETKDVAAKGHSFGAWNTVTEATCTTSGQQRRDCGNCDHYETKTVAAKGHSFGDWYTVREATATQKGLERRDCQHCDHYEQRETDYAPSVVTKVYATITVASLTVRNGPGSGYKAVGYVSRGGRYEVYEQATASNGKVWGRIDSGWICLTGYTKLETVEEPVEGHSHSMGSWYTVKETTCTEDGEMRRDCDGCDYFETKAMEAAGHSFGEWYTEREATATEKGLERRDCANCDHYETRETDYKVETVKKTYGTLTGYEYLRIRAGMGVNYAEVGRLTYGERVEILEIGYVGSQMWGRIDRGWICITGYITLEEVEEPVEHTHSYGEWYTVTEATCAAEGQQRRDCAHCDHFETRAVETIAHSYGDWYTVKEPTAETNGLERRDCTGCNHYEERETVYEAPTVTKVYAVINVSMLYIRSGPGTSYSSVGYVRKGDVCEVFEQTVVNGVTWGRIDKGWICLTGYTTLKEVTETRETGETLTVAVAVLNVRAGAGTGYAIVTSLSYGTEVTVLEKKTVDGVVWARVEQGWVCMDYLE